MAYPRNPNKTVGIIDLVHNTVFADAEPVRRIGTLQFPTPPGAGIVLETLDRPQSFSDYRRW
jgi:hypothetical protein